MTKLYLNTASEDIKNTGLLPGFTAEVYQATNKISKAASSIIKPVDIGVNNITHTISNPTDIFKKSTYFNSLKFLPNAILHELALTTRLPFATVDKAIEHFFTNNMERLHKTLKGTTYGALALALQGDNPNIFRKYTLGLVGKGIEYLGDGTGSIIKFPAWLIQKPFGYINNKLEKITDYTENKLDESKIYKTPYINPGLLKSANNIDHKPKENKVALK